MTVCQQQRSKEASGTIISDCHNTTDSNGKERQRTAGRATGIG